MKRVVVVTLLVGCTGDVDPQWQLDHDRIIAVRASKPRIQPGETSEIDALIGRKGDRPFEASPELAGVVSPPSLAGALSDQANRWIVTAPPEAQLAAARTELGLAASDPVPLRVGVSYAAGALTAVKTVWLGASADNPSIDSATIDGALAATAPEITVAPVTDVRLHVDAGETDDVNWLTSCGTMHDFDLPAAYLRVEIADPQTGDLAVVVRTDLGGVAWHTWPIHAQ